MPNWGLTKAQRESETPPWGLPSLVLAPAKVYTDPVHQDIYLTVLEQWIADSPPFQRLRRVRQLGMTHLVYPGATHTRFSHALGAVRVAQDLLDAVFAQRDGRHPVPDWVMQWEPRDEVDEHVARATVLARLGALLHDIGHVAFGHSIEDDREILEAHDQNRGRFLEQWTAIVAYIRDRVGRDIPEGDRSAVLEGLKTLLETDGELHEELEPLVISKAKGVKGIDDMDYPFVADLVGNTICADLLDYLLRDHMFTGLPAGLGHRFLAGFFVAPEGHGVNARRLALNIMQDGHERPDVISELLKALRYRYELSERALVHHAKLAADVMVSRALEDWADALWLATSSEEIAELDDHAELLAADNVTGLRTRLFASWKASEGAQKAKAREARLDKRVRGELERILLVHGDDGLLEHMARLGEEQSADERVGPSVDRLSARASRLAAALLRRDLYAVGGRATRAGAPAKKLHTQYGNARERSELERRTAEFTELADRASVLLWLPDPQMRMKEANVLVDNGKTIKPFAEYEDRGRGEEIYRAHRDLWAVWAFVDRELDPNSREIALCFLADELGVHWERMRFASRPGKWLTELTVAELTEAEVGSSEAAETVEQLPEFAARREETYADFRAAVKRELDA